MSNKGFGAGVAVVTLAAFIAVGIAGAYALGKINSREKEKEEALIADLYASSSIKTPSGSLSVPAPQNAVEPPRSRETSSDIVFDFAFSPTRGMLPVNVDYSCTARGTSEVVAMNIHRGAQTDFSIEEEFGGYAFYINRFGNENMVGGAFFPGDDWKGQQSVYCSAKLKNGTIVSSKPVSINFE